MERPAPFDIASVLRQDYSSRFDTTSDPIRLPFSSSSRDPCAREDLHLSVVYHTEEDIEPDKFELGGWNLFSGHYRRRSHARLEGARVGTDTFEGLEVGAGEIGDGSGEQEDGSFDDSLRVGTALPYRRLRAPGSPLSSQYAFTSSPRFPTISQLSHQPDFESTRRDTGPELDTPDGPPRSFSDCSSPDCHRDHASRPSLFRSLDAPRSPFPIKDPVPSDPSPEESSLALHRVDAESTKNADDRAACHQAQRASSSSASFLPSHRRRSSESRSSLEPPLDDELAFPPVDGSGTAPILPSLPRFSGHPSLDDSRRHSWPLDKAAHDWTPFRPRSLRRASAPFPPLPPPWGLPGVVPPAMTREQAFARIGKRGSEKDQVEMSRRETTHGVAESVQGSIEGDYDVEYGQDADLQMEGRGERRKRAKTTTRATFHPPLLSCDPPASVHPQADVSDTGVGRKRESKDFWGPFCRISSLIDERGESINYTASIAKPSSFAYEDQLGSWLTYKKNYLSFVVEIALNSATDLSLLHTSTISTPISHLVARFGSSTFPDGPPVELLQFDSSRTLANASLVRPHVLTPQSSATPPSRHLEATSSRVAPPRLLSTEFARIQFRTATSKRSHAASTTTTKPADSSHFRCRVTLVAVLDDGDETELGWWDSASLVVRARNPASFEKAKKNQAKKRELALTKARDGSKPKSTRGAGIDMIDNDDDDDGNEDDDKVGFNPAIPSSLERVDLDPQSRSAASRSTR